MGAPESPVFGGLQLRLEGGQVCVVFGRVGFGPRGSDRDHSRSSATPRRCHDEAGDGPEFDGVQLRLERGEECAVSGRAGSSARGIHWACSGSSPTMARHRDDIGDGDFVHDRLEEGGTCDIAYLVEHAELGICVKFQLSRSNSRRVMAIFHLR